MRPLALASSSPYRRELLERFGLPFEVRTPNVDERPRDGESAVQLAVRLAEAKAHAIAREMPEAIVIGSDQVASLDGALIGKPGDAARAIAQLKTASGRTVQFLTALCVVCTGIGLSRAEVVETRVVFKELTDAQIRDYVSTEKPFDCAGSFKAEALGIALFERLESDDPAPGQRA